MSLEGYRSPLQELAEKYGLSRGARVCLRKTKASKDSLVPMGHSMMGILSDDFQIGKPVSLDNELGRGRGGSTSEVVDAREFNDKFYIKTASGSQYEVSLWGGEGFSEASKADYERAEKVFLGKNYKEWDLLNNKVPVQDRPSHRVLADAGFVKGDRIRFFAEKERLGYVDSSSEGELTIRDERGLPWGVSGILRGEGGYIRKD